MTINGSDLIGDFPDTEYANETCKIGQGAECCRYLTMHPNGWSCEKSSPLKSYLDFRVRANMMISHGDNCEGKDSRKTDIDKPTIQRYDNGE